ncbi:kininogen-1 [Takifugu rubripes]|uniref:Kininogen n=1 Tax=Takifugu rubripes TaxID=31033 RepID=H2SAC8_TAKRU|nr:kininogen [Takifugu rubripes]
MRSGLGLCVLGLLCLSSSVRAQEPVKVSCDDPSVEKAVSSAVEKFNEKLTTGNKLALFQIQSASKTGSGADAVYSLQFTSRRSDCPAGGIKPWTDCDYLPRRKSPVPCSAIVHVTATEVNTRHVECQIDGHFTPEKAPCLGCEMEIDENSEDLKSPLSVSITKYNSMSNSLHLFTLNSVGYATRQVVAGFRFKIRFDMKKTTCAKSQHSDLSDLCVPDDQNMEFANCNSTVDVAPWRHELPQVQMECEEGMLIMPLIKRRPPGWTPLRKFEKPGSAAKEESSEEDTAAAQPSASPVVDVVPDDPLHCPSKPWKVFNPPSPVAPTDAPNMTADAPVLSDTDLLA